MKEKLMVLVDAYAKEKATLNSLPQYSDWEETIGHWQKMQNIKSMIAQCVAHIREEETPCYAK